MNENNKKHIQQNLNATETVLRDTQPEKHYVTNRHNRLKTGYKVNAIFSNLRGFIEL